MIIGLEANADHVFTCGVCHVLCFSFLLRTFFVLRTDGANFIHTSVRIRPGLKNEPALMAGHPLPCDIRMQS